MTPSTILKKHKEEILISWKDLLSKRIPGAMHHDKAAIENSIPDLIEAIISELDSEMKTEIVFHSQQHGLLRSHFGEYSLRHIIQEYNLLKIVLLKTVDRYTDMAVEERDLILYAVDQAVEQAAETFFKIREEVHIDARQLAEKKADELLLKDEYREEFIHSISHDLNNPINNVKACVDLIESGVEIEKISEVLDVLNSNVNQATLILREFLNVGQVNSENSLPVRKSYVDILDDIKKEVKVYEVAWGSKVSVNSSKEELLVKLDIHLIRRAFNNLMSNALKHGGKNREIKVECKIQGEKLMISVQNSGNTIDHKVLDKIFDKYYKVSDTRGGWGLGLSFVKKVAQAHGGDVKVTSNENDGTTFTLEVQAEEWERSS